MSAGEECDIIFTAPWINSYANNVANGVLAPLDDLLLNHAPGLWGSMPPTTWDAARVNGVIYGVINQQIFPKPWGVHPRKDLAEKYGLDLDSVTKWEDMEPWLADVTVRASRLYSLLRREEVFSFPSTTASTLWMTALAFWA